jgi:hypothetical protein
VVSAERKLKWRGPDLSDETRFAVAFCGLSWEPASVGTPLYARGKTGAAFANSVDRLKGFQEAQAAGRHKIAAPFALSLVLDPGTLDRAAWKRAFDYLDQFGEDFDAALVGVMQAPAKMEPLPEYLYAATDALVLRASPRLIPLFLTLADSDDAYLHSRAVAGIGIAAYRAREGAESTYPGIQIALKEASISAAQRRIIAETLQRASEDPSYRVRAAAAMAIGLIGEDSDLPLLEKLAKDRAYLSIAAPPKGSREIIFPVRMQAAASLARFGKKIDSGGGILSGQQLRKATRGARDVTRDHSGLHRELLGRVSFHTGPW